MENSSILDPWAHRHRPYAFSGDSDAPSPSLLSDSISSVVSAPVVSPESLTSHPTPTCRESIAGRRMSKKRKSRASKPSPIAYFTADPAHFRELVQRVTGATSTAAAASPLYPLEAAGSFPLSTLDESSSFDPAGFVQSTIFGSDPALAEFDPLLFLSGFPTLELDLGGVVWGKKMVFLTDVWWATGGLKPFGSCRVRAVYFHTRS